MKLKCFDSKKIKQKQVLNLVLKNCTNNGLQGCGCEMKWVQWMMREGGVKVSQKKTWKGKGGHVWLLGSVLFEGVLGTRFGLYSKKRWNPHAHAL